MEQFRLLSGTALLTVLIWVSADQLLTETQELDVAVTVRAEPTSDMVIRPAPGAPARFRITASGRQADINNLRDQGRLELVVEDSVLRAAGLGPGELNLPEQLRRRGGVFSGFTVHRIQPEVMPVFIDRRIVRDVPALARFGNLDYTVEPRVDPDTVRVTIMETRYDRIKAANPRVVLDAEPYLANQPEDEPIKLPGLPLKPEVVSDAGTVPAERVTPDTVTLRATLRRRRKTGTIQAVPIKFLGSWSVLNRFDIEFRDPNPPETLSLKVVGPAAEIDRLVSGERKTFATISIGGVDALSAGTFQFYKPHFDLPPGVELAEDQVTPSFEIRLVPRTEPGREPDRGG